MIKVLIVDVDGVLSDGKYYISSSGEVMKSFYTRDFDALRRIQELGVIVVILSQAKDDCMWQKFWQLNLESKKKMYVFSEVKNKLEKVENILENWDLKWENVAYVGDAENDLECMKKAFLSFCPNDTIEKVKEEANLISNKDGGCGVVYDIFCRTCDENYGAFCDYGDMTND